jgi:hypothetical protein
MFERILTALEVAVLGLWAGAMAGFAFVFAPIAFRTVPDLTTFGTLIGRVMRALWTFGAGCGSIAILAAVLRGTARTARTPAIVRIALVAVALCASWYTANTIVPNMEATAAQISGPLDSVPKTDPRRAAYDNEHRASTRVYGVAFLGVLGALALGAFGRKAYKG